MLKNNSNLYINGEEYKVIGGIECEDISDKNLFVQYFLKKIKNEEKYLLIQKKDKYILYFEVENFEKNEENQKKDLIKEYEIIIYFGEVNVEVGEKQKYLQSINENNIYSATIYGKEIKHYFGSEVEIIENIAKGEKISSEEKVQNSEKNIDVQNIKEKTQEKIKSVSEKISATLKREEVQEIKKKIKKAIKNALSEKDVRLTKKPINITEIYITLLLILIFGILIMIAINEYKKMF